MGLLKLGKDNWARTKPTKEGMVFLALSLFVGFAALNTGNNLLYLAFGMMMSFIIASGVMSMINLARIEVTAVPPGDSYAATPLRLKYTLRNNKPLIPTYSIYLELSEERVFIPYLAAKGDAEVHLSLLFPKRGWNKIPEARLSTRFPFGFFKKWIRVDTEEREVLVYPRLENAALDSPDIKINPEDAKSNQEGSIRDKAGFGEEMRSIREYAEGDNPKLIHWKTTAKTGRLMVREIEEDAQNKEAVLRFMPPRDKHRLESEISRTASAFIELKKKGFGVEFRAPETVYSSGQTERAPSTVLRYLALFDG